MKYQKVGKIEVKKDKQVWGFQCELEYVLATGRY